MGKDDYVSRQHFDRLFSRQPYVAVAFRQNVVSNEVLGARQDLGPQLPGMRRLHDPGRRRLDRVEVRAIQSYYP